MSHFECRFNRRFWRSKKVVQVGQIGGREGNFDKIQKNSSFLLGTLPLVIITISLSIVTMYETLACLPKLSKDWVHRTPYLYIQDEGSILVKTATCLLLAICLFNLSSSSLTCWHGTPSMIDNDDVIFIIMTI